MNEREIKFFLRYKQRTKYQSYYIAAFGCLFVLNAVFEKVAFIDPVASVIFACLCVFYIIDGKYKDTERDQCVAIMDKLINSDAALIEKVASYKDS